MSAAALGAAVAAWAASSKPAEWEATRAALAAVTPAGLMLRPFSNGSAIHVHLASDIGQSFGLFYVRQPRAKVQDPVLVKLAWAGIEALGRAVMNCPDLWDVGELGGDDGRMIRDANGLEVGVALTREEARKIVRSHNPQDTE